MRELPFIKAWLKRLLRIWTASAFSFLSATSFATSSQTLALSKRSQSPLCHFFIAMNFSFRPLGLDLFHWAPDKNRRRWPSEGANPVQSISAAALLPMCALLSDGTMTPLPGGSALAEPAPPASPQPDRHWPKGHSSGQIVSGGLVVLNLCGSTENPRVSFCELGPHLESCRSDPFLRERVSSLSSCHQSFNVRLEGL